MTESKDCWTPVFARSTKKAMAAAKAPTKSASSLIKAAYPGTVKPSSSTSTVRTLDPEDFPALPTRPTVVSTGKVDNFRCWRRKPEHSTNFVNSSSESFTKDAMYPCLVDTVNAVLETEDAIPKQFEKSRVGKEEDEAEKKCAFEVVPGLSFSFSSHQCNEGANFLERNAHRLFLRGSVRKRDRSRYAFCS